MCPWQYSTLITARLQFRVVQIDKRYKCDILVQGHLVQGSQRYDEVQDAKLHTAAKALKVVQSWPRRSAVSTLSDATHQSARDRQEYRNMKQWEDRKSSIPSASPPVPSRDSGVDMTNPLQARAFVEGFRMGQSAGPPSEVYMQPLLQQSFSFPLPYIPSEHSKLPRHLANTNQADQMAAVHRRGRTRGQEGFESPQVVVPPPLLSLPLSPT